MKRLKYHPRVGENHDKNRIKEEWLKEQFGEQYKLIWNGHTHFALDENTGEMFYIFKKLKWLYPVNEFWRYKGGSKNIQLKIDYDFTKKDEGKDNNVEKG